MFGLDPPYALQMENLLMSRRFDEVIRVTEGHLLQRRNPWDRYFLGLARFLSQDARNALVDMMNLVAGQVDGITARPPEELELVASWGLQLAQMAEIPMITQDRDVISYVELGIAVAELAISLLGYQPARLAEVRDMRSRLWTLPGEKPGSQSKRRYLRPISPRLLQVEPTNHCNLDCLMCPRRKMTRALGFLDLDHWQRMLATWEHRGGFRMLENLALPGRSRFRIHYAGVIKLFFLGEPLLHKQLPELVHLAHDSGAQVSIQTNGVLLDQPKVRERLLDAAPDGIGLSIDGFDAASYETIRQNAQWENLVRGVEALHRERQLRGLIHRVPVNISTILVENNPDNQARVHAFLEPLKPWVDNIGVITLDRDWAPAFLDDQGTGLTTYQRRAKGTADPQYPRCSEPMTKLNMLWDGRITPCCTDANGEVELGHVEDPGGIDGVWNGKKVLDLQRAFFYHQPSDQPFCEACLS